MAKKAQKLDDPRKWVKSLDLEDTSDIAVPKQLVDQVIGQGPAVDIIRKAADQRRHVMLIGDPGTGKSMRVTFTFDGTELEESHWQRRIGQLATTHTI